MLNIRGSTRSLCDGLTRRDFLQTEHSAVEIPAFRHVSDNNRAMIDVREANTIHDRDSDRVNVGVRAVL